MEDTITRLARSLRPGAADPIEAPPVVPAPPAPASTAGSSTTSSSSGTASDIASVVSEDVPLRRRFSRSPAPEPQQPQFQQAPKPGPVADKEWSMSKWLPLLAAAAVFLCVMAAGPTVLPNANLKEDGRPDKAKWAVVAGSGAALAMLSVYAVRLFL